MSFDTGNDYSGSDDGWQGTSEEELRKIAEGTKSLIKVFGVGGGGCNTINRLYRERISGIDLIACNTDAKHLSKIRANYKILLGENLTRGLGSGGDPRIGEAAALESEQEIINYAHGAEVAFVTTGLGGGTGTGSTPIVSKVLKDHGSLTIGVVTLPFTAEGPIKRRNSLIGLRKLKEASDTVIIIPNDKLGDIAPDMPLEKGFQFVDEIVVNAIKAVTEIITKTGLINLDFNDLREVTKNSKEAMIGIGVSKDPIGTRAIEAVRLAVNSPFLQVDLSTSTGVIVNVSGGTDMEVQESNDAVEEIRKLVSSNTKVILGTRIDPSLEGKIQVTIVAGGVSSLAIKGSDNLNNNDGIDYIV